MAPKFGTSGLRGLVTELTPDLVADYVHAFLTIVDCDTLFVGRDLRPSSPDIAASVTDAALQAGVDVVDCGALGTPALALTSMGAGGAAIMVTGSHIPADRNGLKFYLPGGEVSKTDEAAINAAFATRARRTPPVPGKSGKAPGAEATYVARYVDAFGPGALKGLRLGVYRHSSVARDTMQNIFAALGADTVPLAHSETFIPVDTEAVDPHTRGQLAQWCADHGLDAVASTDGDADRPMLTDANGQVVPGDVLGVLTARLLKARHVVTPVSSNDMVRRLPEFGAVTLTRIGSPFVIAGMQEAGNVDVVGFEANGGFLLGFTAQLTGPLAPLPTRDCMLPILAPLVAAKQAGLTLADLVAGLPPCFTAADRLQEIDRDKAAHFLSGLIDDPDRRAAFFAGFGPIAGTDLTDGLRVDFSTGEVVHLRPSGNAPEFRIYAQAGSAARAQEVMQNARAAVAGVLS
ncbi:phosphomannomutase [Actibacterium mucosum KCTC 23349]|uniref:Phosphomannomutase n=1 Tax=Actibacterium mucosum KCTC 23349 TaxID=1454373 RepID=A0A037ZMR3_9RHOB|nr:phosphomannomutase [Actibacterium mucosum]KAJ57384.1 phosphomannomutase [Actibacterium mucosum KCTC 23349]